MTDSEFFTWLHATGIRLTPSQKTVVRHLAGPMVVFAGPGSGKTTTIVLRSLYLAKVHGVIPSKQTIVTFTKRAANELHARLQQLDPILQGVRTGTFHSLFLHWYMEFRNDSPRILSAGEEKQLRQKAQEVVNVRGKGDVSLVQKQYLAYKEQLGVWDYDDILLRFEEMVRCDNSLAKEIVNRSSYWMVDEFQDTNTSQWLSIKTLCQQSGDVVIVGDDDQAIYRFRGAIPHIMLTFLESMPEAKEVILAENFRSTDRIMQCAGTLITCNDERRTKPAICVKGVGVIPCVTEFATEQQEATTVASWMLERSTNRPTTWKAAILARTHAQLHAVIEALEKSGLPCSRADEHDVQQRSIQGTEISIMTLHAAKGLEFDDVVIIGLHEKACPHPQTLAQCQSEEEFREALAEERRLLYVGITRARTRLDLTYAAFASGIHRKQSLFLHDITRKNLSEQHVIAEGIGKQVVLVEEVPQIGWVCQHNSWGSGCVESVELLRQDLHKVGILFAGASIRYVYWQPSLASGILRKMNPNSTGEVTHERYDL